MRRYPHMTCGGVVVGSQRNGAVKPSRIGDGVLLRYHPTPADLDKLVEGMKLAGRVLLEGGAQRVMPPTFVYREYTDVDELDELGDVVRDYGDLMINSAHPQGGNALSRDPSLGVVGPDFRVHGTNNVFVCDASVFPTSITVNPQLTVMALAHYASDFVAAG
jgi:choline dehydrogenase-like flavoprotein